MNFYGIVLAISGSRDVQEFRGTFDFVHRPLTAPSSPRPQNIQRAGRIRVSFDARRVHTHTHTHATRHHGWRAPEDLRYRISFSDWLSA